MSGYHSHYCPECRQSWGHSEAVQTMDPRKTCIQSSVFCCADCMPRVSAALAETEEKQRRRAEKRAAKAAEGR